MPNSQNSIVPNENDLRATVEAAARSTMENEIAILKNGKVERNFTSCFAIEVAKTIRMDRIRVDPFYNKHLGAAKILDGKLIELDIAIHERNTDTNNLVAVELETANNPKRDDVWKLEKLTQELHGFGYKLGFYIVFGIQKKAGQIIVMQWFKNGRTP